MLETAQRHAQPRPHAVPAYLSQWYDIECQIGEGTVSSVTGVLLLSMEAVCVRNVQR